ncbi:aminoglycoside adenylyltransferase domain-containing protein [Bailinhaonella thermotolerans]|uniref:DUF4111 domain-containing protein n=1 Tax=Bailinhaonella thermotolerans TaxID=1070861 RepID=A0A3A4BC77_9ACTN|nr:aminoglycoside adenylyltransferase domain-containing protein [Bailinhaonella thermotolerans]RJL36123.1 DUF4111 domain-containing protein [Bailinhaonella thermotolerans]
MGRYLAAADREAPGLVEGFHLVGSVALGAFREGSSDVDFVAVVPAPPGPAEVAALRRVHAGLRRRGLPRLDGFYVTARDLAGPASLAPRGPYVLDGRFSAAMREPHTPVTWHVLARHGVPVRGVIPRVHADPAELAEWTRGNLRTYWRRWAARFSRPVCTPAGLLSLHPWSTVWAVLGVPRLHATLATGGFVSKAAAGEYALATFPERWHRVVREALRLHTRAGSRSLYPTPFHRRPDAAAFVTMVITDADRL